MTGAQRPSERGFTLIETLVAFTIMAFSLAAMMQAFGAGLRNIAVAGSHSVAVLQARSKLDELGTATEFEIGEQRGEFDNGSRWRVAVEEAEGVVDRFSVLGQELRVYDVEVTVSWGEDRSVGLRTLRTVADR